MQVSFSILSFMWLICFSGAVNAHTKVVVVPLMEDDQRKSFIGVAGAWDCAFGESCRDVYEFTIDKPASVMLDVRAVTGSSVVLTAIYPPGQGLGAPTY